LTERYGGQTTHKFVVDLTMKIPPGSCYQRVRPHDSPPTTPRPPRLSPVLMT